MAVKLMINGKKYDWDVSGEYAKSFLKRHEAKESITLQKLSDKEVKEYLAGIDPCTIGLLIGGGLSALGIWIAYRVSKEQLSDIKRELGI